MPSKRNIETMCITFGNMASLIPFYFLNFVPCCSTPKLTSPVSLLAYKLFVSDCLSLPLILMMLVTMTFPRNHCPAVWFISSLSITFKWHSNRLDRLHRPCIPATNRFKYQRGSCTSEDSTPIIVLLLTLFRTCNIYYILRSSYYIEQIHLKY